MTSKFRRSAHKQSPMVRIGVAVTVVVDEVANTICRRRGARQRGASAQRLSLLFGWWRRICGAYCAIKHGRPRARIELAWVIDVNPTTVCKWKIQIAASTARILVTPPQISHRKTYRRRLHTTNVVRGTCHDLTETTTHIARIRATSWRQHLRIASWQGNTWELTQIRNGREREIGAQRNG